MFLDPATFLRSLLVFARVSGILVAAPVFGQRAIPVPLKVLLGVLLSVLLVGFADGPLPPHIGHPAGLVLAVAVEALTGLLLGYAMRFVFWAVEFAGEMIGFQMSLSLAQAYNPMSGSSANPIGQLVSWLFLVLFLLLDGPQTIILALARSFAVVPLGAAHLAAGGPMLVAWTGGFFATAIRLAMPFLVSLLLVDIALGVFSRVVPQADLFSISLPLKLLAGLAIAVAFMASFAPLAPALFDQAARDVADLMRALGG